MEQDKTKHNKEKEGKTRFKKQDKIEKRKQDKS